MVCVQYFKSSQFRSSQHSSLNIQQTRAKLTGLKIDFNICMGKLPCSRDSGTNFCETHQENLNDQFGSLKSRFEYWLMHPVSEMINLFINVVIYKTISCKQKKKKSLLRTNEVVGGYRIRKLFKEYQNSKQVYSNKQTEITSIQ